MRSQRNLWRKGEKETCTPRGWTPQETARYVTVKTAGTGTNVAHNCATFRWKPSACTGPTHLHPEMIPWDLVSPQHSKPPHAGQRGWDRTESLRDGAEGLKLISGQQVREDVGTTGNMNCRDLNVPAQQHRNHFLRSAAVTGSLDRSLFVIETTAMLSVANCRAAFVRPT